MTYFHGGGHIAGEYVEDADGAGRSGDTGVFVTRSRGLAETYAATTPGKTAWLYEVVPLGPVDAVESMVGGPDSGRTTAARVVRRFAVSTARRAELCRSVERALADLEALR